MNSILIDIIFVVFLLIMTFYGYKKGFITRLYDVLTTILVLFLTCVVTGPISSIWQVYNYHSQDMISTIIGTALNYFLVFVILFVGLFIIKKIVGIFIKPLLKGIMNKFSITSFADKILGIVISLFEAVIFSYIVLVFAVIPFYNSGSEMIQKTVLAKHIVNIVPEVAQDVINITDTLKQTQTDTSSYTLESLTKLLTVAQDYQILNDEQLQTIMKENVVKELEKQQITLSAQKKDQIKNILQQSGYNKEQIEALLKNINVSGE